ncbi:MAG: NAD-binding protein [Thermoanaerobaculia bacterium]|nr:NAD-binding protein [Thermoanaerobaculia bacterium]
MLAATRRRVILVLASLPVLLISTALLYMAAMHVLEGQDRSFWLALEWAAETLTTTGYGRDAVWNHPLMVILVVLIQFGGVFLVYVLVPLLLLPYIEERFRASPPPTLTGGVTNHIVIFRWGPAVETLLEELLDVAVPVAILELDEDAARQVTDLRRVDRKRYKKVHVVLGADVVAVLDGARLQRARAIVANGSDEENATLALVARERGFTGEIVAIVDEPYHRKSVSSAGADAVFTPRHVLGGALAVCASHKVQPRVGGIQQLGRNLRIGEVRIDPQCELAGQTLRSVDLAASTGATVIGQWVEGKLDSHPKADMVLQPRGILLAVGQPESLEELSRRASAGGRQRSGGHFVIAGYGEVGRKVATLLRDVGETVLVMDENPDLGADIVGDIADPETIAALDLESARAIILALDSDGATLFATLIVRGEMRDLPVIARVNRPTNIDRLHRAGADFALSVSQVAAQILAHRLLHRASFALGTELHILEVESEKLTGRLLHELAIRRRTGCSVVAIERGDEVITELGGDFVFQSGDRVYVCGHRADTDRFHGLYAE